MDLFPAAGNEERVMSVSGVKERLRKLLAGEDVWVSAPVGEERLSISRTLLQDMHDELGRLDSPDSVEDGLTCALIKAETQAELWKECFLTLTKAMGKSE